MKARKSHLYASVSPQVFISRAIIVLTDTRKIGRLHGFPECCIDWYEFVWTVQCNQLGHDPEALWKVMTPKQQEYYFGPGPGYVVCPECAEEGTIVESHLCDNDGPEAPCSVCGIIWGRWLPDQTTRYTKPIPEAKYVR